jgi:hypothetical protein
MPLWWVCLCWMSLCWMSGRPKNTNKPKAPQTCSSCKLQLTRWPVKNIFYYFWYLRAVGSGNWQHLLAKWVCCQCSLANCSLKVPKAVAGLKPSAFIWWGECSTAMLQNLAAFLAEWLRSREISLFKDWKFKIFFLSARQLAAMPTSSPNLY